MKSEAILIEILENVIGVKNLSRDARYLDIGGNSLNLVEVLKQIKDRLGVAPPPRIFFDKSRSTVAAISAEIDSLRGDGHPAVQREDSRPTVSATN